MIGSLGQFLPTKQFQSFGGIFNKLESSLNLNNDLKNNYKKNKYKSFVDYVPQDKSEILMNYERKFQAEERKLKAINKKFTNLEINQLNNMSKKKTFRNNVSLFTKFSIDNSPIAKNWQIKKLHSLTRNHNLLRAIVKTEEVQANRRLTTDFQDSFNRIRSGYSQIYAKSALRSNDSSPLRNLITKKIPQKKILSKNSFSINRKKIRIENCRKWVNKRNLQGQLYYKSLSESKQLRKKLEIVSIPKVIQDKTKLLKQIENKIKRLRK